MNSLRYVRERERKLKREERNDGRRRREELSKDREGAKAGARQRNLEERKDRKEKGKSVEGILPNITYV